MKVYVDIDGTVAEHSGLEYENAQPIPKRISEVNQLFNDGHEVYYWTARGTVSGIDYTKLTTDQLDSWGALRTGLIMGKPAFDVFVDDKAFNSNNFQEFINTCQTEKPTNSDANRK